MKKLTQFLFVVVPCAGLISVQAAEHKEQAGSTAEMSEKGEKPTKHVDLPDITSKEKAVEVMKATTDQLKSETKLDEKELGEIHIITYSLEKAIAYFAEHEKSEKQASAKKMAEVVETVHLNSENNRKAETKIALDEYFKLADAFTAAM